jgi:Tfp pilus assembly protein PilV
MSLIEAMIAGAILAVGVSAVLMAFGNYSVVLEHQRKQEEVWRLLHAQASLLRSQSDAEVTSGSVTLDRTGQATDPGNGYTISWTASPAPFGGGEQVNLVATWSERTGTKTAGMVIYR